MPWNVLPLWPSFVGWRRPKNGGHHAGLTHFIGFVGSVQREVGIVIFIVSLAKAKAD